MGGLATDFPASDRNRVYVSRPLVDSIVGDLGPILIIVMSATGLLLLLACVNVANLLLARGAARAREMAVRAALGAGWSRLVRQLLTESLVLATAGTIVGVGVGALGLRALLAIGASKLPRLDAVTFDGRVLLFSLAMLVVTGAIIGLAPAVRLLRSDMKTLMNDSSRSASAGRGTARWLMAMTVAEVALAIMLVAGAGWLVRGFSNLRNTNAGFVTDKRLLFDVSFLGPRYPTPDAVRQAHLDLMTAVRNVRGVTDVGLVSAYPMRGRLESSLLAQFHGEPFDAANPPGTRQRFASPGLFAAMGTAHHQGSRFRNRGSPEHGAGRDRQPRIRRPLPQGTRPDRRAVFGRISGARSEERGDDRRRGRRRETEVSRRAGGAGVLLAADAVSTSARDRRRVDVAIGSSAPSSEPSARRCGSSTRRWRSISSSRRTSSAARSGGRSSG